ncbi:MAG: Gfo/Idh/MocA family oxidoreductase, partial [Armatimonadota bacterium]
MADKKIRTGVIGLGLGAGHVAAYQAMDNAEVIAICDISEPWLKYCQDDWKISTGYTDYREMLKNKDIDAISIALPTKLHAEATIEALQAGKHVLVEKPMAVTGDEAQAMADAAKKSGRVLMVSYNQRFGQDVMFLKRYIGEGHLGDIYFARTLWRRPLGMLPPAMHPRPTGAYNRNWFNEANNGGGVARDLGSHVIDIAMWLLGFPEIESVTGKAFNIFLPEWLAGQGVQCDADDHSVGFVKFKNGACLQIEAAFGSYS